MSRDGDRVAFLRSDGPEDPRHSIWVLDVATGREQRVLDPGTAGAGTLSDAERARRERARESGEGVVAYTADRDLRRVAAAVDGALVLVDLHDGTRHLPETSGSVFDPRMDPTGTRIAHVVERAIHLVDADLTTRVLASASDRSRSWGMADFIAAEEFGRPEAIWWSPAGDQILVQHVDVSPVHEWHLSRPHDPAAPARTVRYPAAGTPNADWHLSLLGLDASRLDVDLDRGGFEYLTRVHWSDEGPPIATVMTRDQRTMAVLEIDPTCGATKEIDRCEQLRWVEQVEGLPRWCSRGLVTTRDIDGVRRLVVDGEVLSPADLQVRSLVDTGEGGLLLTAWFDDPTQIHVVRLGWDGTVDPLTTAPGVHNAVAGGRTTVVASSGMDHDGIIAEVRSHGDDDDRSARVVASRAAGPGFEPNVRFLTLTDRRLHAALVLPRQAWSGPLPVLLDPYGGPHAQRVLRARSSYWTSQWFADRGLAVLVVDGRGTPGRGPVWEQAVHGDLAGPVLEDQVDALHAAAEAEPDLRLDLDRVGIRGWSFGGYLAALAVLRRPDVFRVAVAGAPVTDWRLYDTAYTERYLGHPAVETANYERGDLTALAPRLRRPLLLIHGLSDDNVFAAHSLRLSQALFEAGRMHSLLLLSETSHMTPQEVVAENLLRLQFDFLAGELGLRAS